MKLPLIDEAGARALLAQLDRYHVEDRRVEEFRSVLAGKLSKPVDQTGRMTTDELSAVLKLINATEHIGRIINRDTGGALERAQWKLKKLFRKDVERESASGGTNH